MRPVAEIKEDLRIAEENLQKCQARIDELDSYWDDPHPPSGNSPPTANYEWHELQETRAAMCEEIDEFNAELRAAEGEGE